MSSPAVSLLRAHLDQLRLGGRTTVSLSAEALGVLAKMSGQKPLARAIAPTGRASAAGIDHSSAPAVAEAPLGSLRQALQGALPHRQAPIPAPPPIKTPPPIERAPYREPSPAPSSAPSAMPAGEWTVIDVPGTTIFEKLNSLAMMAESDPGPRSLGTLRPTMVFATGSPEARLMFVGEAPGEHEEQLREPFVGPAGQLLTKIIENAMGLKRPDVYISNICKFRPSTGSNQGSRNRPPAPEEMGACLKYIQTEIRLIRPSVIVALGATAATGLGIAGAVGRLRSRFHAVDGIPTMVTYHPSYILRQELEGGGTVARRQVWEDMLMVMEKLGMPISEKQRGFFKPKV